MRSFSLVHDCTFAPIKCQKKKNLPVGKKCNVSISSALPLPGKQEIDIMTLKNKRD